VTLNKSTHSKVKWCYFDIIHVLGIAALIIASFRHKGDEICALSGCYAAKGSNYLPNFRDNPLIDFLILEFGIDVLSRKFGMELSTYAA
jgi:hypothetical protein